MCAYWNYKKEVWGMILLCFGPAIIAMAMALTFPIILFVMVASIFAVGGLVYLIRRKK